MKKRFMALFFGLIILIIFEIFLIYIACMPKRNKDDKFRYEDTYICIRNETNYTTLTTPEHTTNFTEIVTESTTPSTTIKVLTTMQSTELILTSTAKTPVTENTNTMSSTQSETSTYSEIPLPTTPMEYTTPMENTTPKWTKNITSTTQSRISRRPTISTTTNTRKTTWSSITSIMTTMTENATKTTAFETSNISSGTSSQIPSEVTSTIEIIDKSTSARTMEGTTTVTAFSQTSSSNISENSSIDISTTTSLVLSSTISSYIPQTTFSIPPPPPIVPTALPTAPPTIPPTFPSTTPTTEITMFGSTTIKSTSVNRTEMTTFTDENTRNCTEVIVTDFTYVVRHAMTKVACILINMKMWINLQYAMEDSQTGSATLTVPTKARTTGKCEEKRAEMILSWDEPTEAQADSSDKENRIVFHYAHNDVTFFLDSVFVDVHLDSKNFPRARQERISGGEVGLQLFYASVKDGVFICTVDTAINVENQIIAVISDMHLIAFNNCSKDCWKTEDNCIPKTSINIGAIIGAVIIGIILILTIFYLMWRKKRNNFAGSRNFTDFFSHNRIVLKKWLYFDTHHREC